MRRERDDGRRFGKALDEDVKIGVNLALAPPSAQNHCRLNSHILISHTHVRTILFDCCRAQTDVAPRTTCRMDLWMPGRQGGQKARAKTRPKRRVLLRILPSLQSLGTHEERLLVERERQEWERGRICGDSNHASCKHHDDDDEALPVDPTVSTPTKARLNTFTPSEEESCMEFCSWTRHNLQGALSQKSAPLSTN